MYTANLSRWLATLAVLWIGPILCASQHLNLPSKNTIWSDALAKNSTESSPMGNGRLCSRALLLQPSLAFVKRSIFSKKRDANMVSSKLVSNKKNSCNKFLTADL